MGRAEDPKQRINVAPSHDSSQVVAVEKGGGRMIGGRSCNHQHLLHRHMLLLLRFKGSRVPQRPRSRSGKPVVHPRSRTDLQSRAVCGVNAAMLTRG